MKCFVPFVLLAFVTGCGTTIHRVQINPATIDFVEHRTFWSTTAVAIVSEGDRVVGIGSGTGKPIAAFVADITATAAIAGALGYIGTQLPKINTGTSTVSVTGTP